MSAKDTAYLTLIDDLEGRIAAMDARLADLQRVGDALWTQAEHAKDCALQHGSWCTCAMGEWMRLGEGV